MLGAALLDAASPGDALAFNAKKAMKLQSVVAYGHDGRRRSVIEGSLGHHR